MATKRLKFLSRKKILQKDVRISLEVRGRTKRFSATLSLAEYEFPGDAAIVVEAKQLLERLRFDFGTVAVPRTPAPIDISRLGGERVIFNVLVLDRASARKLGSAETIRPNARPEEGEARIPLLPVDASTRIAPLLWKIDYSEQDRDGHADAPVLVVDANAAENSAVTFMDKPGVKALVLPAAMREVLTRVLVVERSDYDASSTAWRNSWLRFAERLVGDPPPNAEGDGFVIDAREWIDTAVSRLSEQAGFVDQFIREQRS